MIIHCGILWHLTFISQHWSSLAGHIDSCGGVHLCSNLVLGSSSKSSLLQWPTLIFPAIYLHCWGYSVHSCGNWLGHSGPCYINCCLCNWFQFGLVANILLPNPHYLHHMDRLCYLSICVPRRWVYTGSGNNSCSKDSHQVDRSHNGSNLGKIESQTSADNTICDLSYSSFVWAEQSHMNWSIWDSKCNRRVL